VATMSTVSILGSETHHYSNRQQTAGFPWAEHSLIKHLQINVSHMHPSKLPSLQITMNNNLRPWKPSEPEDLHFCPVLPLWYSFSRIRLFWLRTQRGKIGGFRIKRSIFAFARAETTCWIQPTPWQLFI